MAFTSDDLINRAINILKGANAAYSITGPDGTVYENVNRAKGKKPKTKTNDPRYKTGERMAYVRASLQNLACGEIRRVPFGKYDGIALRNSLSAYISLEYKEATTSIDHSNRVIEVLRIA